MTIIVTEIEAERGLRLLCRVGDVSRWLPAYSVPGVVGECDLTVTLTGEDEDDLRYEYEERAGILEFDCGLCRGDAERQARLLLGIRGE